MRWLRRRSRDDDIECELRSHLDLETREQRENGLSPEEALYAAKRAFGNTTLIKETVRATWRWSSLERITEDLRYASRMLRKTASVTAIAVISLAIAIGANTATFSILDAWLLRPLPFKHADRLVTLLRGDPKHPAEPGFFPLYRDFKAWKQHSHSFTQIAGAYWRGFTVTGWGDSQQVAGMVVTENLFDVLGVHPLVGRTFLPTDLHGAAVAVIGYGFWQEHFGGRPGVLGKTVELNGKPYEIIGVIPRNMGLRISNQPADPNVYLLLQPGESGYSDEGEGPIAGVARLKPRVTLAVATAELNAIQQRVNNEFRGEPKGGVAITSLQSESTWRVRPSLLLMAGAVCFLLLIVCANVASLLAGRAIERRREMALRAALGSGRARLLQQLITEDSLLALLGAAAGVLFAFGAIQAFTALNPFGVLPQNPITLNWHAILFACVLALCATALFGVAPALEASRLDINEVIKGESHSYSGTVQTMRFRRVLVTAQIAISFALLIGCALMIATIKRLEHYPLGFHIEGVHVVSVSAPRAIVSNEDERAAFFQRILQNIRNIPGVTAAGISNVPPLNSGSAANFAIEGQPTPSSLEAWPKANAAVVTPGYFSASGVPLLDGRGFSEHDTTTSEPVIILNEAAARHWFGASNPLGRQIRLHEEHAWRTVVGIVGDTGSALWKTLGWKTTPEIYIPQGQSTNGGFFPTPVVDISVYVRARTPLSRDTVKAAMRKANPFIPIVSLQTMAEAIAETERQPKLRTAVLTGAAISALLLAALGLYGVISQSITQRTREIGIRMAIGAESADVLRLVLRQALRLAIAGMMVGVLCAFLLVSSISNLLYGVTPASLSVWLIAASVLLGATIAAALIPALRAANVDPATALRYE